MADRRRRGGSTLVLLLCALLVWGCGSSGSSNSGTHTASTPAALAAITGHDLSRLNDALPVSTARLPTPSTKQVVERAYLTELFDDAQTEWRRDFATAHLSYTPAHLVVYWSKIESACGKTDDSGPFYCPSDRTVYLDLKFFTLLVHTFGVRGVAQAYIVGHEVAHHVQRLLGIARLVDAANHADPHGANARSVKVELEADCLAGVWGRAAYQRARLTTGDLNDALRTAEVIGDDYQSDAAGEVDTSEWTHGSSRQRQYWLRTGFRSGKPVACDTFASR